MLFPKTRRLVSSTVAALLLSVHARAAVPLDFVVDVQAAVSDVAPHITLSWTQRQQSAITSQKLYRRQKGEPLWELLATLSNTQTNYTDFTAHAGVEYEYWMERVFTGMSPNRAIGYLSAGVNVPCVENRGSIVLLVDSTMAGPLAPEIAELQRDLVGDGWKVIRHDVPRMRVSPSDNDPANWPQRRAEIDACRELIRAAYNEDPSNVKAVYLLGRVPVPYSGYIAPDGHTDHAGAWPADVYYGEMDGTWTDTIVNRTTASGTRNDNVPGDGKLDQGVVPSQVELQVGRVDLANMTKFPSSGASEVALLRRYLRKVHEYRHQLGAYANVPRRSLIRDGFGHLGGSEPFAAAGWATAFNTVGNGTNTPVDQAPSDQWFTTAAANSYLWGYGNGSGSNESASTLGTSSEFGRRASRVVFTSLFGSYHGDWDQANNFLRAPLAGTATGDSLGLVCFWSGRPHWFLHPCGMGENVGYAARLAQDNSGIEYAPSSAGLHGVHIALMGDPTLRFHMVPPPRNLSVRSTAGTVLLRWSGSSEPGLLGYHVYRAATELGPFVALTTSALATPDFTDSTAEPGQTYTYMVRALKLESVPGGSYQNLSQGVFATVTTGTPEGVPFNPSMLSVASVSSTRTVLTWSDNSDEETGFRIERRTNADGTFTTIGAVGTNETTFTDPGPLAHGNVYFYRIVAVGTDGDSHPSNEVAMEGSAGFFDVTNALQKVSRYTRRAILTVNRFGGNTGPVTVAAATSDDSAIAGTHYLPFNGTVQFGDGETGTKSVYITLANSGASLLPRQFKFTLSSPGEGGSLAQQTVTRVLIEDPNATLPSGWQQAILGSVVDSSPAAFAENAFGSALIGGSIGTSDNGHFIYQSHSGDGVLTAYINTPLPAQSSAIFGIMIRRSTSSNEPMAAVTVEGDAAGTNFAWRTTSGANPTLMPGDSNNLKAPRWVRLTRQGEVFTAEHSSDGVVWSTLGSQTVPVPANALWGIFHAADGSPDFQLARFQYVTLTGIDAVAPPASFRIATQAPGEIGFLWDPVGGVDGYRVERRALNGVFSLVQLLGPNVTQFSDTSVHPGVTYEYRIQSFKGTVLSVWSAMANGTALGTVPAYTQWLQAYGLPMDGSGAGAATACPAGDEIPNAMKHALGLDPRVPGYGGRIYTGLIEVDGQYYLALTFRRPDPAPIDTLYEVQISPGMVGGWSTAQTVKVSDLAEGGIRTITVRDAQPVSEGAGPRFIRLSVRSP